VKWGIRERGLCGISFLIRGGLLGEKKPGGGDEGGGIWSMHQKSTIILGKGYLEKRIFKKRKELSEGSAGTTESVNCPKLKRVSNKKKQKFGRGKGPGTLLRGGKKRRAITFRKGSREISRREIVRL